MYVVSITIFALIYNVPRFWEVTWSTRYYPELDENITEVDSTDLREDPLYINVYITWLYLVFLYIIPFTCLAVFNLLIYKEVPFYDIFHMLYINYGRIMDNINPSQGCNQKSLRDQLWGA